MSAAPQIHLVSVEDYLGGELSASQKHEYLAGVLYAMAGARNVHNIIGGNIFAALKARLRGLGCRPYNSDTKIRLRFPSHVRFYYPDVSVVCRPNPQTDSFQDEPVLLVEVLSRRTRRLDEGEKKDAYLSLPSVSVYLLVEQETAAVTVFRRTETGFARELAVGLGSSVALPELGVALPLDEVYEDVEWSAEED